MRPFASGARLIMLADEITGRTTFGRLVHVRATNR
jgi:hypothetical protein